MNNYSIHWRRGFKSLLLVIVIWALLTIVAWPYYQITLVSIAVSLVCFVLYGIDKKRALYNGDLQQVGKNVKNTQKQRVSEAVLHFWAFLGGTPGAFIAQQLFRHKTQKRGFKIVFYLMVMLQLSFIMLLKLDEYL